MMDDKPHNIRIEREPVEVTTGPLDWARNQFRVTAPGRARYFVDDIELTKEEFDAWLAYEGCVTWRTTLM